MAVPFERVLAAELQEVEARRAKHGWPGLGKAADTTRRALDYGLLGMGISGGGIRSATFNLGLLQGLAAKGLLPYLDYLSTVSGGGYIGSWLHSVIRRYDGGDPAATEQRLLAAVPLDANRDPISWLRKYSNYLSPRLSPFSQDVWGLGSLWLRNMLLNQCVLLPFLAAVLLLPLLLGHAHALVSKPDIWWILSGVLLLIGVISVGARLRELADRELKVPDPFTLSRIFPDAGLCATLVFLAMALLGWTGTNPVGWPRVNQLAACASLLLLFILLQATGGYSKCFAAQHKSTSLSGHFFLLAWPPICAAVTAGLLVGSFRLMRGWDQWNALAWGPVLAASSLMAGVSLLVGLMGADYPDGCREWLSRTGATISMMVAGWCALFAIGVFAPWYVAQLFDKFWGPAVTLSGAWVVTTLAGVLAGRSGKTSSTKGRSPLEFIAKIAPFVFLAGYLVLISMANYWGLRRLAGENVVFPARHEFQTRVQTEWLIKEDVLPGRRSGHSQVETKDVGAPAWSQTIIHNFWSLLGHDHEQMVWILGGSIGSLLLVSIVLGLRININEFSIHHLYKNRLVRCYLGASQGVARKPNAWTGFDPNDDLKLSSLTPANGYYGPYALVNTALNINRGAELAKQERKAASFVFTPKYCGYQPEHGDAYTETAGYSGEDGPSLGLCMAISGAAVNPNMGYHTSGPMAFLLTVFNVRLGWWLGNPAKKDYADRPGPRFALPSLLNELLGRTNDRSSYLNLSDGGHFDNLGLYELVRRRCRFIIIGDGEQDPGYSFGSLASTVRRCRADFGIEINLDFDRIRRAAGPSIVHAVVGEVIYPEVDSSGKNERGTVLYVKSSITGDEPEDIKEFRSRFPAFPHQSTGDQFFDEPQFESYRKLGLHVAHSIFERVAAPAGPPEREVPKLFRSLHERWYPPSAGTEGSAAKHVEVYSALMARLAADPELRFLDAQILPGALPSERPSDPIVIRRARFFCNECIQLVENVYTDLKLGSDQERNNPNVGGWMALFTYWASQPEFQETWAFVKQIYNPLFRQFFESL